MITDRDAKGFLTQSDIENVQWDKFIVKKGVDNLREMLGDEQHRRKIYKHSQVLLLLGLSDILADKDGFSVGNNICALLF